MKTILSFMVGLFILSFSVIGFAGTSGISGLSTHNPEKDCGKAIQFQGLLGSDTNPIITTTTDITATTE